MDLIHGVGNYRLFLLRYFPINVLVRVDKLPPYLRTCFITAIGTGINCGLSLPSVAPGKCQRFKEHHPQYGKYVFVKSLFIYQLRHNLILSPLVVQALGPSSFWAGCNGI